MENEEIDLIEVMAKLWHRKKTIMYIALFFLVGGLVLAFFYQGNIPLNVPWVWKWKTGLRESV